VDHLAFFLGCSLNLDFKAIPSPDMVLFKFFCWILQEQVAKLESIPVEDVYFYCSGSPLNEDVLVANLRSLSIDVSVSLKGGKVHGSLARAGKVKDQTSKVRKSSKSAPSEVANVTVFHNRSLSSARSRTCLGNASFPLLCFPMIGWAQNLGVGLNLPSANPQLDQVNFVPEC
jgi:ribosomal protein S30